ncbi:MAG TPA: twin-arginine translocase subunit TatB, partial [Rubrivivax sp.]|nr:twin-arginine translocase subunit TatB [Rubrivivax sp.]
VKAEVNRSIDLEELKKMKTQFQDAAQDVEQTVRNEVNSASAALDNEWNSLSQATGSGNDGSTMDHGLAHPPPSYTHPKKNWRLKRGATPQWYKKRQGIRTKALSGAARVARFRPRSAKLGK